MPAGEKLRLLLQRDGLRGALRTAAARAAGLVALSEHHVWYLLATDGERPRSSLAPGLVLERPRDPDMRLLTELMFTLTADDVRARLDAGNDLWLALEDGRALFGCWIFRAPVPTIAAPGGELALPADTVCLEDSLAAPAARGRGVAPATWTAIADSLAAEGRRWMVTKVAVDNAPARRAVEKAGFEAVVVMHFSRALGRPRTSLEELDSPHAGWFVEHIGPGLVR